MTVPVAGGGVHTCAAELEEGGVVLTLGCSGNLQAVNGQIPGCDVGVLLTEFRKLALPYFIGEIPYQGNLGGNKRAATALRLDGDGYAAFLGFLIVDVTFCGNCSDGETVKTGLKFGDCLCRDGATQRAGLQFLGLPVELHNVGRCIVNGVPGSGNCGFVALGEGNGLNGEFRSCKDLVAGLGVKAPGKFGEGNCAGGEDLHQAFALDLGDDNLLDACIGRCHCAADHRKSVVVLKADYDRCGTAVSNLKVYGTSGILDLEGGIALDGSALPGNGSCAEEVDGAVGIERSLFSTHKEEFVPYAGVLYLTCKQGCILEIPHVSALKEVLGEILGFLHIGDPPLGSANLSVNQILVCELEEVALGVVAGILGENLESCSAGVHLLKEGVTVCETVVVLCIQSGNYGTAVVLEQMAQFKPLVLCILAFNARSILIEEEVVLQRHGSSDADCEDTAVVAVVDGGNVLDGVVLHDEAAALDITFVDGSVVTEAYQGTETVPDGVVLQLDGLYIGVCALAEVNAVT